MLVRGHIGYVPGIILCIGENMLYMEEVRYDYIAEFEKRQRYCVFLHTAITENAGIL